MKWLSHGAVALLSALIGVAVGTGLGHGSEVAGGAAPAESAAEIQRLTGEVARLSDALAEANRAAAESAPAESAESEAAAATIAESEAAEAVSEEEPAPAKPGAAFLSETYPCLDKVNWKEVGTSLSTMAPLIRSVARSLMDGESPTPEEIGEISQHNGKLITAALTIQNELPGYAPNGSFTDPAFMVNAIVATLEEAGIPASEEQRAALEQTARRYVDEDQRRRRGYDDRAFEVRTIYEEAELKDRFFAEAFTHLTTAQVDVLEPDEIRRRLRLSLFSSGTMLVAWARPYQFSETSEVVGATLRIVDQRVGISEEEREQTKGIIEDWLGGVPAELLSEPGNPLDLKGMVRTERVIAWGKQSERLLGLLSSGLSLDEERRKKVRGVQVIGVPVRRPAEER